MERLTKIVIAAVAVAGSYFIYIALCPEYPDPEKSDRDIVSVTTDNYITKACGFNSLAGKVPTIFED